MRRSLPLVVCVLSITAATAIRPAVAQNEEPVVRVDLGGLWSRESHEDSIQRATGPSLGDYTGIPINAAGRLRAESWDASILSVPEEQAKPHAAQYSMRGPGPNFRMGTIVDPITQQLIAYTITNLFGNADRTIWLDGRSHPSVHAEHTWSGFSTGVWEDDGALKVTTTHMKTGWLQRNGVAASSDSTMTEYFFRHDGRLTLVTIVEDPVYLEEPFVRTSNFVATPTLEIPPPPRFVILEEVVGHPQGYVPSYPMGTRHTEFAAQNNLPFEATRGGARTIYPEYALEVERLRAAPAGAAPQPNVPRATARPLPASNGELEILPVQGSVHMIVGPTGNVTALIGDEGVLLVDTDVESAADKVAAAIRRLSPKAIGLIVNTSISERSTGGNVALAKLGISPVNAPGNRGARIEGAPILAHENVMKRMSEPAGGAPPAPSAKWPSWSFFTGKFTTSFDLEPIEVLFAPNAHSDGDVIVFFRKSDVVSAGNLFSSTSYPLIDLEHGGSVQGFLDALNRIIDIAIPEFNQQRGTLVVPGQGRIGNESDVVDYRDMLTIVRDRIQRLIDEGKTLTQVKSARPTLDYDGVYGATSGPWTTDMFVEVVYRDLMKAATSPRPQ